MKKVDSKIAIAITLWVGGLFFVVVKKLFNPTLTGAIIAVSVVVIGVLIREYLRKEQTAESEKKDRIQFAKSLYDELNAFYSYYFPKFRNHFDKADPTAKPPVYAKIGPPSTYFTVYNNSSHLLGLFNSVVSLQIQETYMQANSLVDLIYKYQTMTGEIVADVPTTSTEENERELFPDRWKAKQRMKALTSERSMLFIAIRKIQMDFEKNFKEITQILGKFE